MLFESAPVLDASTSRDHRLDAIDAAQQSAALNVENLRTVSLTNKMLQSCRRLFVFNEFD